MSSFSRLRSIKIATVAVLGLELITATGCEAHPPPPEICIDMCTTATELYGGCLDGWGSTWETAGFEDEAAHQNSCETWAWELSILGDNDSLVDTCEERLELFESGDCGTYTGIDWNEHP
jgi:hypothetical protein